ncbi:2-oxo acid dehydrogenase subunit E2 [Microbacterium sp. NPDC055910]|uniref:2-oxo acid dehydrogenase subunit E2 n=1 Tax=Microbacterium sp. NPDC055910 TaxID=3345659 RepID=UPI0035D68CA8
MTELAEEGIVEPLKGMRRTAARRMVQAWAAPVFHVSTEIDMSSALQVRTVEPTANVTDAILRAVARALKEVPDVNVHVAEDAVVRFEKANVGIAVDTPKGLVVPVVHDISDGRLADIARARADVVARARDGALTRDDITGGTITVSNLGMMGVTRFDAILNVPQAAILAVGATVQRFVHRDGDGVWAPIAEFTLTCDHRALDGATGARFLTALKSALEEPLS